MENYKNFGVQSSVMDVLLKAIKYFIEGLAVAVACHVIPKRQLNVNETLTIALTAAATFAVLDLFSPAVGSSARQGAGLGLGLSTVGFTLPHAPATL